MSGALVGVDKDEDRTFRAALDDGRFLIRHCSSCDTFDFPPAPMCWRCGSASYSWQEVAAGTTGVVYTWTTCHRSFLEFADQVPFTVVVAALPDFGEARVLARLADESIAIGDRVELVVRPAVDGEPGSYSWRAA